MSTPEQPTFSHSGQRYLLGYTSVEYAIWDRQTPGPPIRKFAKSEAGWSEAWAAYQGMEAPPAAPVAPAYSSPAPVAAPAGAPAASAPTTPIPSAAPAGPPRPPFKLSGQLVAQVLTIAGWALLALMPIAGIALMVITGAGFANIMQGLANIAFGPALWGICLTLAGVARRNG
jgi:hypothetical protein